MQSTLYDGKYIQNGGPCDLLQRPNSNSVTKHSEKSIYIDRGDDTET